jgi:hypothetical protein
MEQPLCTCDKIITTQIQIKANCEFEWSGNKTCESYQNNAAGKLTMHFGFSFFLSRVHVCVYAQFRHAFLCIRVRNIKL